MPTREEAPDRNAWRKARRQEQVSRKVLQALAHLVTARDAVAARGSRLSVVLTDVLMSADLRAATVLWLAAPGSTADVPATQALLQRHARALRRDLARTAELRFAPRLVFRYDGDTIEAQRVHEILEHLAREREAAGDPAGTGAGGERPPDAAAEPEPGERARR
eukprot:CAMPEP_0206018888 /NCGR_PEP_ID=MMETSP1464-20131121/28074_1 /ASSEMBLY_ACC=CAM_ASM_001124 /TAXON_ID=119497 /ORGANISM="Exanthemachrysis gayraliae, Strain RCC1523" /LENGTH=163 /DNA_ID=CAMNT_0053392777 /DNA_START=86 /DNA_END=577 /DNA_ORIENTATION=+